MLGHGGSSAGSYLADPYLPHPLALCCHYPVSKCPSASIVATSTLRVNYPHTRKHVTGAPCIITITCVNMHHWHVYSKAIEEAKCADSTFSLGGRRLEHGRIGAHCCITHKHVGPIVLPDCTILLLASSCGESILICKRFIEIMFVVLPVLLFYTVNQQILACYYIWPNCVFSLIFVAANIYVDHTLHRRAAGRHQI